MIYRLNSNTNMHFSNVLLQYLSILIYFINK